MFHLQPPRQSYAPLVIPSDRAVYRLKEQIYADDELYEPGTIITWDDTPNMAMEPMNDLANEMFKLFIEELDKHGRSVAEKTGKSYRSLADALTNAHALAEHNENQKSHRLEMLNASKDVPIMGGKIKKRGARVESESAPLIDLNKKHSLNGNTHGAVNQSFGGKKLDGKEKE